jgi:hypothetical protein
MMQQSQYGAWRGFRVSEIRHLYRDLHGKAYLGTRVCRRSARGTLRRPGLRPVLERSADVEHTALRDVPAGEVGEWCPYRATRLGPPVMIITAQN